MSTHIQDVSSLPARVEQENASSARRIEQQTAGKAMERVKLGLQIVSTLAIVFAAFAAWVAYQTYKSQHEWNRRHYSMELLRNYDRDGKPHSDVLLTHYSGLINSSKTAKLTKEQASALYFITQQPNTDKPLDHNLFGTDPDTAKTRADFLKLRQHLVANLNYVEYVCKAYEAQVVDQQAIYEAFNGLFIRRHDFFEEFIKIAQEQQEHRGNKLSWEPIVRVVTEWKSRNAPTTQFRPPTG